MTEAALQFSDPDKLGRVASVDTSHVAVDVANSVLLTRIGIGQLVAIRGATEREYLIAMTERVTRSTRDELPPASDHGNDSGLLATVPTDVLQGVLIGTVRTIEGAKANTFKRGAAAFPKLTVSASSLRVPTCKGLWASWEPGLQKMSDLSSARLSLTDRQMLLLVEISFSDATRPSLGAQVRAKAGPWRSFSSEQRSSNFPTSSFSICTANMHRSRRQKPLEAGRAVPHRRSG